MTTAPDGTTEGLRERVAEAATRWALMYPIASWRLAEDDKAELLAKIWGDQIADAVIAALAGDSRGDLNDLTARLAEQLSRHHALDEQRTWVCVCGVEPGEEGWPRHFAEVALPVHDEYVTRLAARAAHAEAERDALKAAIEKLSARHQPKTAKEITRCPAHAPFGSDARFYGDCPDCREEPITVCSNVACCEWPCEDRQAIDAALAAADTPGTPEGPENESRLPVDWEAIAKQRERELRQVGEARHRAEGAIERIRELRDQWALASASPDDSPGSPVRVETYTAVVSHIDAALDAPSTPESEAFEMNAARMLRPEHLEAIGDRIAKITAESPARSSGDAEEATDERR